MNKINKIPVIISIIMLLLAIPSGWPYGYYTLLRFIVCGTSVYLALFAYEHKKQVWLWLMGFITLLFNPLIPVHLNKESWTVIDLLVALIMLSSIFIFKETKEKT